MRLKYLWILLISLVILSPIGLLAQGTAWGEWSVEELEEKGLGFVPQGLQQLSALWEAPFADYQFPGLSESFGYVISGLFGVSLVVGSAWVVGLWLSRKEASEKKKGC